MKAHPQTCRQCLRTHPQACLRMRFSGRYLGDKWACACLVARWARGTFLSVPAPRARLLVILSRTGCQPDLELSSRCHCILFYFAARRRCRARAIDWGALWPPKQGPAKDTTTIWNVWCQDGRSFLLCGYNDVCYELSIHKKKFSKSIRAEV